MKNLLILIEEVEIMAMNKVQNCPARCCRRVAKIIGNPKNQGNSLHITPEEIKCYTKSAKDCNIFAK